MLSSPAKKGEHDGTWDNISRTSKEEAKTEAGEGTSDGGGANSVRDVRVQVITRLHGNATGGVPPIQQAIAIEHWRPDCPKGGADGEPLRSRDNGKELRSLGAESAIESANGSAGKGWDVSTGWSPTRREVARDIYWQEDVNGRRRTRSCANESSLLCDPQGMRDVRICIKGAVHGRSIEPARIQSRSEASAGAIQGCYLSKAQTSATKVARADLDKGELIG